MKGGTFEDREALGGEREMNGVKKSRLALSALH